MLTFLSLKSRCLVSDKKVNIRGVYVFFAIKLILRDEIIFATRIHNLELFLDKKLID